MKLFIWLISSAHASAIKLSIISLSAEVRTRNLSSPVVSGKSSPNYSGKNSPCSATHEERRSQRSTIHASNDQKLPKGPKKIEAPEAIIVNRSVAESKIEDSPASTDEKEQSGTIQEVSPQENHVEESQVPFEETDKRISMNLDYNEFLEQEEAEKMQQEVKKLDQSVQTNLEDDHLTLAMYLEKHNIQGFFKGGAPESAEIIPPLEEAPPPMPVPEIIEKVEEPTVKKPAAPAVKEPVKRPPSYSIVVSREEAKTKPLPTRKFPMNPPAKVPPVRKPLPSQQSFHLSKSSSTPATATTRTATVQKSLTTSSVQRLGKASVVQKVTDSRQRFPGAPTNTARRISARSSTMIDLKNNRTATQKGLSGRSSGKHSQEDVMSSSSTLKASSDSLRQKSRTDLSYRKSEPKSLATETNDGWLTVKSRSRRSSLHWSNRFNQPSGYASLPILSLLDETPAEEAKEEPEKQPASIPEKPKSVKNQRILASKPKLPLSKSTISAGKTSHQPPKTTKVNGIVRQKSDLAESRSRSLRESARNERLKKAENKLIEVKTPEPDDDEIYKVDMNIQTLLAEDLRNTINLSSCDEMDDKDLEESDDDQKKLLEEQENLERQIRELENTEIDVDTETDETDCEVLIDAEDIDLVVNEDGSKCGEEVDFFDENMTLEMKYQSLLSDMSSGERLETLATLQAFVARHPGRAQELHQKLSSPSRRRSLHETLKKYQAKQTRAQEKRESLQREKTQKIQQLLARVEDVKAAKQQLIEEKRLRMEERLQRAAENRTQYLKDKVKKAHDEEEKLKEIAFIKSLEAQNKRLDIIESCKEHEVRLQDLEQERQKRVVSD